jgi:DNA-binding NtrC family response regulator
MVVCYTKYEYTLWLQYGGGKKDSNFHNHMLRGTMTADLNFEERFFFGLVRKAVAANPFSEARQALDRDIAGGYGGQAGSQKGVDEAVGQVRLRIDQLDGDRRGNIGLYSGDDRQLVQSAILFDVFHRLIPPFDRLINEQLRAGEENLQVPFASEALKLLTHRGFTSKEACRYFGLFFQMRRAFFFIQQSLVGSSPCMVLLRESLWNNVFTHDIDLYNEHLWRRMEDFSTMILGPTGAGKGTAAAAIGRSGYIPFDRKKMCFAENFTCAFIPINLSQFSETLIESELFGHRKGAFTGAIENYQGVFDRCSPYGAILLDEIGEVSRPVQIKLLQVLQERRFVPVGDHNAKRFSGRVIAATNRRLNEIRERRILRDDFFYRLCSDIIIVPGLYQRIAENRGELKDLVDHTIQRILGKRSKQLATRLHKQIVQQLGENYAWPGNVRELEQCVRRLLIKSQYTPFQPPSGQTLDGILQRGITNGTMDAQSLLAGYCYLLYKRHGTYEAVAQRTRLDRRTAKKHIEQGMQQFK